MEILVLIKQVPDDSVDIQLDPSTNAPKLDGVTPVTNAFDTYALEMATRFKEANGGTITLATIGDDGAVSSIKECLAVGGDKGFLIKDDSFADSDPAAKGYILSKAAAKLEELNGAKFDIIFAGKEATDFSKDLVPAYLAQELGVPVVSDVIAVDPADGGLLVKQETDTGYNMIDVATPCVLAIQKPDYDPRYPTIKNKMKARKAQVPVLTAADLGTEADKVGAAGSLTKTIGMHAPAKKQAGVKIVPPADVENPIAAATAQAVSIMAEAKVL